MIRETTYTGARSRLAALMDQVIDTREPVLIRRRGKEPVALVAAEELAGWIETAYLLRSPKNARRLRVREKEGESRLVSEISAHVSGSTRREWKGGATRDRSRPSLPRGPRILDANPPQADAPRAPTHRSDHSGSIRRTGKARAAPGRAGRLLVAPDRP